MKKNILGAISEFSKKLSKFEESEKSERIESTSDSTKLQNEISLSEEERKLFLYNEYKNYDEPITREIEEDEENLLKAYELFKQIEEINLKSSSENIRIVDNRIFCPICNKTDYIQKNKFVYLKIWFILHKKDSDVVPEISSTLNKKYCLDFIKKEDWKPTSAEKEMLQIIEEKQ